MTDRIGALARSIAALKVGIASARRAPGVTPGSHRAPTDTRTPGSQHLSQVATLPLRLATLPRDRAGRRSGALRLFVEAVLLDEFGGQLSLDGEFGEFVERVVRSLEGNEASANLVHDALDELLADSATPKQ